MTPKNKKIITIVGARPQFIKAAVVSRAIANYNNESASPTNIQEIIVHTGQHYDENMSQVFFNEMKISKPKYFLNINKLSHGAMTGQMLEKIEQILLSERPDIVLVYGDTNSTLAGALAASKLHIPLAHVEAGLRSYNRQMPEETNRVLTDHLASFLFCPTSQAITNLQKEGIDTEDTFRQVHNVGDVMYDATLQFKPFATPPSAKIPDKFVLATVHRAENTNNKEKLTSIFNALQKIAKSCNVVLPLHPGTRTKLKTYHIEVPSNTMVLLPPVCYTEMLYLLQHCQTVLTDSGGLQKEAFFMAKPCLTLRDETEWVELIETGANILTGTDQHTIIEYYKQHRATIIADQVKPYGDGSAAETIITLISGAL